MILTDETGQAWEFLGYDNRGKGTHVLSMSMDAMVPSQGHTLGWGCFRKAPKRHTFGPQDGPRVVYEETGDVRQVNYGEAFLHESGRVGFWFAEYPSEHPYPILRPVEILEV